MSDSPPSQRRPKGFQRGHKYHPPKMRKMHTRHLAIEAREVPASIHVAYRQALASGYAARLGEDEDGELCVVTDETAMPPSQQEITAAMNWLAERGWGSAPQMMHIENIYRVEMAGGPALIDLASRYSPAKLASIRALLDLPASPASGQQPASQPASTDLEPELVEDEKAEDAEFTMQGEDVEHDTTS